MTRRRVKAIAAVCLLLSSPLIYAQQKPGAKPTRPLDFKPSGKNILMVCGDENKTVVTCTSIGDVTVKNRIELEMGHKVTRIGHDAPADEMLKAANAADLVIITESTLSGTIGSKIVSTPTAVLSSEAFLQDEFLLVNPKGKNVEGRTAEDMKVSDFGTLHDTEHSINIVNPKHPLAAGLSGRVRIYRLPGTMHWGGAKALAPSAEVVATLVDYPDAKTIYVIRRGARLYDGTPAPGLRIQYFIENDNERGTTNLMSPEAWRLWDAAINYALTTDVKK